MPLYPTARKDLQRSQRQPLQYTPAIKHGSGEAPKKSSMIRPFRCPLGISQLAMFEVACRCITYTYSIIACILENSLRTCCHCWTLQRISINIDQFHMHIMLSRSHLMGFYRDLMGY